MSGWHGIRRCCSTRGMTSSLALSSKAAPDAKVAMRQDLPKYPAVALWQLPALQHLRMVVYGRNDMPSVYVAAPMAPRLLSCRIQVGTRHMLLRLVRVDVGACSCMGVWWADMLAR